MMRFFIFVLSVFILCRGLDRRRVCSIVITFHYLDCVLILRRVGLGYCLAIAWSDRIFSCQMPLTEYLLIDLLDLFVEVSSAFVELFHAEMLIVVGLKVVKVDPLCQVFLIWVV